MSSTLFDYARKLEDATGIQVSPRSLGTDAFEELPEEDHPASFEGIEDDSFREKLRFSNGKSDRSVARNFLVRLGEALLTFGGSAPRAEYLVEAAADALHVNLNLAVFQSLLIFVFPNNEDGRDQTCLLTVDRSVNVDKLHKVDELAIRVSLGELPVGLAYWRLKALATSPSVFGTPAWQILSYGLSSLGAAPLFYSGNVWDALISMALGLAVGTLTVLAEDVRPVNQVVEFVAALMVAVVARLCSVYLPTLELCFFAICISSLVWLLPGEELTIGISEIVEQSPVTGTARLMQGLVSTLQLGFGMAIGQSLVWWEKSPLAVNCGSSGMSAWWNILWFLGFAVAINILLRGRLSQWPGMMLAAGIGFLIDSFASEKLGSEASAALASFGIGITGGVLSRVTRDIPLSMILAGIQVVLPGQIGVQGVVSFVDGDESVSGVDFVLTTVVICLSITIGLMLSKIAVQDGMLGITKSLKHNRRTLAKDLSKEVNINDREVEEDSKIAI